MYSFDNLITFITIISGIALVIWTGGVAMARLADRDEQ